jgi:anaerobic selenocysteine-containing dehydrogenase
MALRPFDRPDGPDPGVSVHPSAGIADGAPVVIRTPFGQVASVAHHDPGLRPDTVDLPAGYQADVGLLVPLQPRDAFVGSAAWNGLPCTVEPA